MSVSTTQKILDACHTLRMTFSKTTTTDPVNLTYVRKLLRHKKFNMIQAQEYKHYRLLQYGNDTTLDQLEQILPRDWIELAKLVVHGTIEIVYFSTEDVLTLRYKVRGMPGVVFTKETTSSATKFASRLRLYKNVLDDVKAQSSFEIHRDFPRIKMYQDLSLLGDVMVRSIAGADYRNGFSGSGTYLVYDNAQSWRELSNEIMKIPNVDLWRQVLNELTKDIEKDMWKLGIAIVDQMEKLAPISIMKKSSNRWPFDCTTSEASFAIEKPVDYKDSPYQLLHEFLKPMVAALQDLERDRSTEAPPTETLLPTETPQPTAPTSSSASSIVIRLAPEPEPERNKHRLYFIESDQVKKVGIYILYDGHYDSREMVTITPPNGCSIIYARTGKKAVDLELDVIIEFDLNSDPKVWYQAARELGKVMKNSTDYVVVSNPNRPELHQAALDMISIL